jgi:hypothetical protein
MIVPPAVRHELSGVMEIGDGVKVSLPACALRRRSDYGECFTASGTWQICAKIFSS